MSARTCYDENVDFVGRNFAIFKKVINFELTNTMNFSYLFEPYV